MEEYLNDLLEDTEIYEASIDDDNHQLFPFHEFRLFRENNFFKRNWLNDDLNHVANKIFSKIKVRPPYFALENISSFGPGSVKAQVYPEQSLGMECGPMCAGEAGRHMAILGSCAVSLQNDKPSYYLSEKAILKKHFFGKTSGKYEIYGKGEMIDKKLSRAQCQMYDLSGNLLYTLEIVYLNFSERVFERLFLKSKQDLRKKSRVESLIFETRDNPYLSIPHRKSISVVNNVLTANTGIIHPSSCKGHFAQYPSLPVAILTRYLCDSAGELLKHILEKRHIKYHVSSVTILAKALAFAGDNVHIKAKLIKHADEEYHFHCKGISTENKIVGDAIIVLKLLVEMFDKG